MLIAAIDVLFLVHVWAARDFAWMRRGFAVAAGAWWIWLAACSAIGTGGFLLGLLAVRLPLLSVALGDWALAGGRGMRRRRILWLVLAASAAWIGVECWEQYLTGHNLFGQPRWGDGALTGPFNKPRAGPGFILLFFPALVPAVMVLLNRPSRRARVCGVALAGLAVLTMVLIGQRMPTVLMALGLVITALLLPRLRLVAAGAAGAGLVLLAATPVVSRPTYDKLVVQFGDQLRHFGQTDYGLIFVRAINVAQLHRWIGLGFDGFRRGCGEFWAAHGVAWLGIPTVGFNGGLAACNLHPHNYYLEAADNAGLPGLVLFTAMVVAALWTLGRGLWRAPDPLRVGLFVGALVALWPIASTSAFTSMPNGGWVFVMLGFGFSLAKSGGK
jgi:O-antigen ligase